MASIGLFRGLNFHVVEHFLDAPACRRYVDAMRAASGLPARVALGSPDNLTVADDLRRTMRIEVKPGIAEELVASLEAVRDQSARHFDVVLARTEDPQFLRYRQGDFYVRHMDRDLEGVNQRKVSVIIFLNSPGAATFTGGGLKFYGVLAGRPVPFTLVPEEGLLIAFRSDIPHEVERVTAGERLTAVTWFA